MDKIIAFPGLGFQIELNTVAFSLGSLTVKWYGIILTLGIIAAFVYFYKRGTKTELIKGDHIYNMTLWCIPLAIVGARFMYVITTLDSGNYKTFIDYIAIWEGGIAIYGAIIAGGLTIIIYCKAKKIRILKTLDCLAPAVMLGQVIGRWGNFVNGECYGWSEGVGNLPWRMQMSGTYKTVFVDGVAKKITVDYVHPTFLYESLWNLIGFLLINLIFYKKKKFNGQIFCLYMGWYGIGRAFVEMLRTDSLYITGTQIKASVLIGFIAFATSIVMYIILAKKNKPIKEDLSEYTPKFAGIVMQTAPDEQIELPKAQEESDESEEEPETDEVTDDGNDN